MSADTKPAKQRLRQPEIIRAKALRHELNSQEVFTQLHYLFLNRVPGCQIPRAEAKLRIDTFNLSRRFRQRENRLAGTTGTSGGFLLTRGGNQKCNLWDNLALTYAMSYSFCCFA